MHKTTPSKSLLITLLCIAFSLNSFSQVGIGTTDPKTQLEVDGALSLREGSALTLSNGSNTDINLGTTPYSVYRITGPTTAFQIGSIIPETGADGQIVTLINSTSQNMTIVHTDPGGVRRIFCPDEVDVVLTGRYSSATFQYNASITKWILVQTLGGTDDWKTTGNAGTDATTNFVGTTDDVDLIVKRNNVEHMKFGDPEIVINEDGNDIDFRIETDNDFNTFKIDASRDNVGINKTLIDANLKFEVDGDNGNAIYGHSNNVGGYLGRETNITIGVAPATQTLLGAGVYANNPFAGYTSVFSQSTGAATVAASVNYSDVWMAAYDYVDNARSTYNPSAAYFQLNNTAGVVDYRSAIFAYSNSGTTATSGGIDVGGRFQSVAQNDNTLGIFATNFSNGSDVSGAYVLAASYAGTLRSRSWVANYFAGTDYKILGSGAVSTLVKDDQDQERIMFAPEAPEVLLQDFGVGRLVNGVAEIRIDPILSKNIVVDSSHPLKVFIQLEGDCKGVYVTNKSKNGFIVRELQGGTSSIDFSYQLVANRKDRKGDSDYEDSKFQDLRFPIMDKSHMPRVKKEEVKVTNKKK